jgi:hypothetical protein
LKSIAILLATLTTFLAPMKGLIMMVLFVVTDTILEYTYQLNLMVYQHLNHTNYSMVIKTFFYLQTMLMGFLLINIFWGTWYIILAAKTMTTL